MMRKASAIAIALAIVASSASALTIEIDESKYTVKKRNNTVYLTIPKDKIESIGDEAGAFRCANKQGNEIIWSQKDGAICTATIGQYVRHITK